MWSIFSNEDLTLHVEKKKEEKVEKKIKRKKSFEKNDRSRSLNIRRPFSSFYHYDSRIQNKIVENKINTLKRKFRIKYRIARTNLLKLIKIIKKIPDVENEEKINIESELVRKLNKVIEKIDVDRLKAKRKKKKNKFKNINTLRSRLSSNRNFSSTSNIIFPYQTKELFRNKRKITKRNVRPNFILTTPNSFRNINKHSFYNSGLLYSNSNIKNPYNIALRNRKKRSSSFYDTNTVLVTDMYTHSTLNTSLNKFNSYRKKKNLPFNSRKGAYSNSLLPYFEKYINDNNTNIKNVINPNNSNFYSNYSILDNLTQYIYSPKSKNLNSRRKRLYSNKQLKKFTKEEKIRNLLRTASNEDELLKAIDVAKNAGLSFEAKLGDKKLQKLKTVA